MLPTRWRLPFPRPPRLHRPPVVRRGGGPARRPRCPPGCRGGRPGVIGKLTGIVDSSGDDWAILDVGGVGYMVFCSGRTLGLLPPARTNERRGGKWWGRTC